MEPHSSENGRPVAWIVDWSAPGISWMVLCLGLGLSLGLTVLILGTGYMVERVIRIQDMREAGFLCILSAFIIMGLSYFWLENHLKKKSDKKDKTIFAKNFANFKLDLRIYSWFIMVILTALGLIFSGRKVLALNADWIGGDVVLLVSVGFAGIRLLWLVLPLRKRGT